MNVQKRFYHHTNIERSIVGFFILLFTFFTLTIGFVVLIIPGILVIPGFLFLAIKYYLSRTKITINDKHLLINQREGVFSDNYKIPLNNIKSVNNFNSNVVSGNRSNNTGGALAKLALGSGSRTKSTADRMAIHTFKKVYQLSPALDKKELKKIRTFLESTIEFHNKKQATS